MKECIMNKSRLLSIMYISVLIWSTQLFGEIGEIVEISDQKNTVRILTLNTALLSVLFGKIDINMKDIDNRAALIGQTIKAMSPQPDIIVFQEAFNGKALRNILYNEIKNIYPHTFFDMRTNAYLGGGVDSGLAMLSKYPITRKLQKDFSCWAGVEALARKGVMGAELLINGCQFYMFTAHFQAGISKDWYIRLAANARDWLGKLQKAPQRCEGNKDPNWLRSEEIVNMELREAKKEINGFVKNKTAPVIFAGDFNISRLRDLENYDEFLKTFPGALDTYINGSQKIKSTSWEDGKVADTQTDRVDYIWLLNPSPGIKAKSDIIDNFTSKMTDHLGILGTIEFSCKNIKR